jgi:hypothetical protein
MGDFIQESYKSPFIALLFIYLYLYLFIYLFLGFCWRVGVGNHVETSKGGGSTPLNKLSNAGWYT